MTSSKPPRGFAERPSDADAWIKTADRNERSAASKAEQCTARLTIDVTPDLRGRIKIIAFRRGVTVADMLRDLLAREFPRDDGGQS
ncbi:hypothetical protein [Methylosinus sp. LW3]|jgi:hypothetical protein|uniref:hypothetical protein n=1 Tax=Methylosinus sp. LW3 TaxID=107635 RepID=UPI000463ED41|nr:hypothetical protein [Methylosinus sp. LW3]